jgi:hypothetical protein
MHRAPFEPAGLVGAPAFGGDDIALPQRQALAGFQHIVDRIAVARQPGPAALNREPAFGTGENPPRGRQGDTARHPQSRRSNLLQSIRFHHQSPVGGSFDPMAVIMLLIAGFHQCFRGC